MKKQLPQLTISQEMYNKILSKFTFKLVDKIQPYIYGYTDKRLKVCQPNKYMILQGKYINYALNDNVISPVEDWKQYRLVLETEQHEPVLKDFNGNYCRNLVLSELYKLGLTKDDIENRLNMYQMEKSEDTKPLHALYTDNDCVLRFENCIYYDLTKAYSDSLSIIFPELRPWLIKIANRAKKDPRWKRVPNFFTGMLNHRTPAEEAADLPPRFTKTFNWITARTRKIVLDRLAESRGSKTRVVYMNTDGIVIQHPVKIFPSCSELGKFKIETEETTFYTYRAKNYEIIQYGDTIKGNLPVVLRDRVDLRLGKVISLTIHRNDNMPDTYDNIEEHLIPVEDNI